MFKPTRKKSSSKDFFERRVEREKQLRTFSILQFSKKFSLPSEEKSSDGLTPELSKILSRNKAVRAFKRRELKGESEETRVHSCLLEYGESFLSPLDPGTRVIMKVIYQAEL